MPGESQGIKSFLRTWDTKYIPHGTTYPIISVKGQEFNLTALCVRCHILDERVMIQ